MNAWRFEMEKILKKVKKQLAQSGGLNIAIGSVLLAVTIPFAILSIISGAKLLKLRKEL
jgi:hypothetical protein